MYINILSFAISGNKWCK